MQFFHYDIPLHPSPFPFPNRIGILVQTELGWGEIAPFPNYRVDFGIASAHVPFPNAFPRIPYSALASSFEQAEEAAAAGFHTLKIKVGTYSPQKALELISRIQSHFSFQLRIDVNRRWSVPEAQLFLNALDLTAIEYIEEPFNDPQALALFPHIPFALDETLLENRSIELLNCVALILKPTLLGKRLAPLLTSKKKLIFSSTFESSVGLLHIAHLQARYSPNHAVGIDTFKFFTKNFFPVPTQRGFLLDNPLPPHRSKMAQSIAIDPDITYDQLQKRIDQTVFLLAQHNQNPFILKAHPTCETIVCLFAAWSLSRTVLLLPPELPETTIPQIPQMAKGPDLLLLTSGSSGTPKLAAFNQAQLFESADTVCEKLNAKPHHRWLLSLPLHHVGGLGVLLRSLRSRGTLVFANKQLSHRDRLLSAQAQFASYVPTQLYRLLQEPSPQSISTHLLIGGASLSPTLYQKALEHRLSLSLTYALTEMSSTVLLTSTPVWDDDQLPFLGSPLKGRDVRLSEQHELLTRGAPLFEGYGIPPQKPEEWFATGDLARIHKQHGVKICGRKDFQFLCGGENIQPEEIEAALLSLPEIDQAIVVPLHDEEFGARPGAFVRSSLSSETTLSRLSNLLPKSKIPIRFFSFPNSESLKPNRKKLTELANSK